MMEKVKEFLKKIPDWVKAVVASAVIIAVAVVVNDVVQRSIYRNVFDIKKDDFSHVFQIDNMMKKDGKLVLEGWVFKLDEDAIKEDFEIILYDYNNDKAYYMDVEDVVRSDVNKYFLCEYDYSESGFLASLKLGKIDLENTNYVVLIRPRGEREVYKSGTYISNGEMMCVEPESFVFPDVKGTELEEIVNEGIIRVYRPDAGMYVYQYNGYLYWMADASYVFEEDGSTIIQYQLDTTQIDNLPENRLANKHFWDNISFVFEAKEMEGSAIANYRVAVSELPTEYSIEKIWTGYHVAEWKWIQYFRPWYEFE